MFAAKEAERFARDLADPTAAQARVLEERILGPHRDTDFGRRHGFDRIRTPEDYRQAVPIRSYEGFRADVDRMVAGETNVLVADPVKRFFLTSGSTAQPKYIPVTNRFVRDKSRAFGIYWSYVFRDHPEVPKGRMITNFSDRGKDDHADSGIPVSSESAYWAGVTAATQRKAPIIPKPVAQLKDAETRYHAIARVLLEEEFTAIMALNPSTILLLFQTLNDRLDSILDDVARGGLQADLPFSDEARAAVAERYPGNPARADALRALCAPDGPVRLSARAAWPRLALSVSWRSPMLQPYLDLLSPHLSGVAERDYISMASEGIMSVPLSSGRSGGAVAVGVHYYEYVPLSAHGPADAPALQPHELELGQEYVVVLSNGAGLYRYDIGDVVRVCGFEGPTPIVEFLHRAGRTCSLTGEKLTEDQVTSAVAAAAREADVTLVGFTAVPSAEGLPHYLLLAELEGAPTTAQKQALLTGFEAGLDRQNVEYGGKRRSRRLGPPELWVVAPGSYKALERRRVAAGTADMQYKPTHLTRQHAFVDELDVVERLGADHGG